MQATADLRSAKIAEIGVQVLNEMRKARGGQSLERARSAFRGQALVPEVLVIPMPLPAQFPQIRGQLGLADEIPDLSAQERQLAGIEHLGAVVLLHQSRQRSKRSMTPRVSERRHQMTHDNRVGAPFCLRAFAWIVDHERIEQGQIAQQHVRRTIGRERETLARQPFKSAVRAKVDERIRSPDIREPAIESYVVVTGRQVRSVIGGLRIDAEGAWRLQGQPDVSELQTAEQVAFAIGVRLEGVARSQGLAAPEGSGDCRTVDGGRTPQVAHVFLKSRRLRQKPLEITAPRHSPWRSRTHRIPLVVTSGGEKLIHQRVGRCGRHAHRVARIAQCLQEAYQRSRGIQSDGTAHALGFAAGVGQDHRNSLLAIVFAAQRREAASQIGHPTHTLRIGYITVAFFEGNRRRDDSPVALGQSDVHSGLHGAQSMGGRGPHLACRPATDGLQPGRAEGLEATLLREPRMQ